MTSAEARPDPPPTRYYLRWQGRVSGPFDLETIEQEWQAGSISRLHQVSSDKKMWQALGTHPDLKLLLNVAPLPAFPALSTAMADPAAALDAPAVPAAAGDVSEAWEGSPAEPDGRTRLRLATRVVPSAPVPYPAAAAEGPQAAWAPGWPGAVTGLDLVVLGPAPWGRRLGAAMLDLATLTLVGLCGWLLLRAVGLPLSGQTPAQKLICGLILAYCAWLYSAVLESCAWQATLGKLALGLRVQAEDGARLDFGSAALRAFMKLWSMLPALAGVLIALRSPTRQTLHDIVARTYVVGGLAAPAGHGFGNQGAP
jgi:uncharacterized RDD family membrane protein YckC